METQNIMHHNLPFSTNKMERERVDDFGYCIVGLRAVCNMLLAVIFYTLIFIIKT